MSKLLIIGASVLQLPAIKRAKELGHFVAVADYNPEAVGIPYANQYFNASTIDEEAICRVAEDFRPDGIMTLATDMPMRAIAKATTRLGLPGISYDTAVKATDKFQMIEAFRQHGVASPWYHLISSAEELQRVSQLPYPCIIKPTDNAGSRGVSLVHSAEELFAAYDYSRGQSRHGNVIIEEYLQGREVSVEVMVVDGTAHILAITDKLTTGAPYFVEMGHSQPSDLPSEMQARIHDLTAQAIDAVGIHCGPAHVEMMITDRGPVMIELGARMGGDCITTHLVPLSTGIDMIQATIDVSLGYTPDLSPRFTKGSAIRFFESCPGILQSVAGIDEARKLPGIQEISIIRKSGEKIASIRNSTDRIGFVVAQADTAQEAVHRCEAARKSIRIESK